MQPQPVALESLALKFLKPVRQQPPKPVALKFLKLVALELPALPRRLQPAFGRR
ncbi:MAG: hypothetical protein WB615_07030 [Candidatus Tumulicola sp.]